MAAITLSSKYQIVIPREARERLGWKPGQKLHPIVWKGEVHLVPVGPIAEAEGILGPAVFAFEREEEDRQF
jgi:AbrB family looped-hinge helix DNA binding protein